MPPEVKVRISVEGTPEALAAFRQVQQQAQKSGRAAAAGMAPLNGVLSGMRNMLATIAGAVSVAAIINVGVQTAKTTAELGDLAQMVGTTASRFSSLNAVAEVTGTSQETLVSTLGMLGQRVQALKDGEPAMVAYFHRLGLSAKDFPTDDIAQAASTVAIAMQKHAIGYSKSAEAAKIMGKEGKALIPVLERLGEMGGLEGAMAFAKRTGKFVDEATVLTMERLVESTRMLKMEASGAAVQFMEGFGPRAADVLEELNTQLGKSPSLWKQFGQTAIDALRPLVGWLGMTLNIISGLGRELALTPAKFEAWRAAISKGDVAGATAVTTAIAAEQLKIREETKKQSDEWWRFITGERRGIPGSSQEGASGFDLQLKSIKEARENNRISLQEFYDQRKTLVASELESEQQQELQHLARIDRNEKLSDAQRLKARSDVFQRLNQLEIRAQAALSESAPRVKKPVPGDRGTPTLAELKHGWEEELKAEQAKNAAREANAKASYEAGKLDLQAYFAVRMGVIEDNTTAELDALTKEWKKAREIQDPTKRALALKEINARTQQVMSAREKSVADTTTDRLKAEEELANKRLEFLAQYSEAQGNADQKELADLGKKVAAYKAWWAAASAQLRQGMPSPFEFTGALAQKADLDELQRQADKAIASYRAARDAITARVTAGFLTEYEGEVKLRELERDRLDGLRQIADELLVIAIVTNDSEALKQSRSVRRTADELAGETKTVWQRAGEAGKAAWEDWAQSLVSNFKSVKEAGLDAARGILSAFARIGMQEAANWLWGLTLGHAFTKKAGGGLIRGPGTGTSDSIPAWLSDQEHVQPAARVREPGALPFLEDMRLHGFIPALGRAVARLWTPRPTPVPELDRLSRAVHAARGGLYLAPGTSLPARQQIQWPASAYLPRPRLPRFAEGGPVAASQGSSLLGGTVALQVPEGVTLQSADVYLNSPKGKRQIVQIVLEHRRPLRQGGIG